MLPSLHRRVGFWLDDGRQFKSFVSMTARLAASDAVLITAVDIRPVGKRLHVRISLTKAAGADTLEVRGVNTLTGDLLAVRLFQRQKRQDVNLLPSILVFRLCKDRRWLIREHTTEAPVSALDD